MSARLLLPLLLPLLALLLASAAHAETLVTVQDTGPAANRVDIVILGEGYTQAEQGDFARDVDATVAGFFAQSPFDAYRGFFNVHRVEVISAESGADHPKAKPPQFRDTAFNATYNCFDIERLICVEVRAVYAVLDRSVAADQRDVVLVLVNDDEYGGSGGAVGVASRHPDIVELVLHELGHSFGLLADEYDTSPPTCVSGFEPVEANATKHVDRQVLKWNPGGGPPRGWVAPQTALPTSGGELGRVGAYEGSRYCGTGLYRPTFDSKMRTLKQPFESVNAEQLVRRIYNFVSPIDAYAPANVRGVYLAADARRRFRVDTPAATVPLTVTWFIDGRRAGQGSSFLLRGPRLKPGIYTLRADVSDPTTLVRNDPENLLRDSLKWTVAVGLECDGRKPTLVGTNASERLSGTPRADVILGLGGDDTIDGRGGDDVICGGDGNDLLRGGAGADTLIGGAGQDECSGGGGRDSALECEALVAVP